MPATVDSKIKITLDRETFGRYLSVLSVASSKIVKASQCILFDVKESILSIKATNLTVYLKYEHGKVDCPDCSFMLPIDYITPLVSRSNSKDVVIEQIDHQKYKVVTDGEYTFAVMDGVEFPSYNEDAETFMEIDSGDLKDHCRKVAFAIAEDVTKSRYLGIYFDGNFIASNGKHIACVESKKEGNFPQIFIPRNVINIVNEFSGTITLGLNKNKNLVVKSKGGNLLAITQLLAFEKFLPYKDIFSRFNFANNFTFNVKKMSAILNRLAIFVDERMVGIRCTIDGKNKKLILSSGDSNTGVEEVDLVSYTGPDEVKFIFNHSSFSDLMEVINNENCHIKFSSVDEPFIVEDEDFKYMMSLMVEK